MSDLAGLIQLRSDTAANWTSSNPTLAVAELGVETDTLRTKIGDGSTAWTSLAYSPILHLITQLDTGIKTGADAKLVTGTAGSAEQYLTWNADGDAVGTSAIIANGDTAANLTSGNPVLAAREIMVETDTLKFKIGDGSTAWNSLAYGYDTASASDVNTGTNATKAVTSDALAGSNFGISYVQVVAVEYTTDTATGNGKAYFHIPPALNGMNLIYVHGEVITAGTTGTTDIQIANETQANDMLSTKLTIDSGETGSDTAAAAAVIDTSNDHVATNDRLRIDIDAVSTTAAKGLIVTMGFQLP